MGYKINDYFLQLKSIIMKELNIVTELSDEELKNNLDFLIASFEDEFKNIYPSLFIYTYYKKLLDGSFNNILFFVLNKKTLNIDGKENILKQERNDMKNSLDMIGMEYINNCFVSKISGKTFNSNQKADEIINNDDVFLRPPKGDPKLIGPHALPTLAYDSDYWVKFKDDMCEYISQFEKNNDREEIKNYYSCVKMYNAYITVLGMKNLEGGNYVKN